MKIELSGTQVEFLASLVKEKLEKAKGSSVNPAQQHFLDELHENLLTKWAIVWINRYAEVGIDFFCAESEAREDYDGVGEMEQGEKVYLVEIKESK